MVKTDFGGREIAKLCINWTLFCPDLALERSFRYISKDVWGNSVAWILFKYGRSAAIFGHDTGRRLLIVGGPTLKNYYGKNYKR